MLHSLEERFARFKRYLSSRRRPRTHLPSHTPTTPRTSFLDLALELRLPIYRELLTLSPAKSDDEAAQARRIWPAITQVNAQIRNESIDMLYKQRHVELKLSAEGLFFNGVLFDRLEPVTGRRLGKHGSPRLCFNVAHCETLKLAFSVSAPAMQRLQYLSDCLRIVIEDIHDSCSGVREVKLVLEDPRSPDSAIRWDKCESVWLEDFSILVYKTTIEEVQIDGFDHLRASDVQELQDIMILPDRDDPWSRISLGVRLGAWKRSINI